MTITPQQFASCAPSATPATVDALFALDWRGASLLNRVITRHDFTDAAIAQFFASASLASNGFTKFNKPFFGVGCASWLVRAARLWRNYGLNESADEWDWQRVVECSATIFNLPSTAWLKINDTLAAVCKALGVVNDSEAGAINDADWLIAQGGEFALEDRGATEM